jgi:hypothetical protein
MDTQAQIRLLWRTSQYDANGWLETGQYSPFPIKKRSGRLSPDQTSSNTLQPSSVLQSSHLRLQPLSLLEQNFDTTTWWSRTFSKLLSFTEWAAFSRGIATSLRLLSKCFGMNAGTRLTFRITIGRGKGSLFTHSWTWNQADMPSFNMQVGGRPKRLIRLRWK